MSSSSPGLVRAAGGQPEAGSSVRLHNSSRRSSSTGCWISVITAGSSVLKATRLRARLRGTVIAPRQGDVGTSDVSQLFIQPIQIRLPSSAGMLSQLTGA